MEMPQPFSVSVLSGMHAGAVLPLAPGSHLFGRDRAADVVLEDSPVAARHFTLDLSDREVVVEAMASGLVANGTGLEPGDPVVFGFPLEIALGDIRLRIDDALPGPASDVEPPPEIAPTAAPRSISLIAVGAFLVCSCVAAYLAIGGFGETAGATGITANSNLDTPNQRAIAAAKFLSDRLARAGFAGAIVAEAEDGTVRASGVIPPEKRAAWEAIQRDYDGAYGSRVILHAKVQGAEGERPNISIQAVWSGPQPYVVVADGDRVPEGGSVGDGWTVEAILGDHIDLHRGGASVSLKY